MSDGKMRTIKLSTKNTRTAKLLEVENSKQVYPKPLGRAWLPTRLGSTPIWVHLCLVYCKTKLEYRRDGGHPSQPEQREEN